MRIEHVAIWTRDLERLRAFDEHYLGARAGERYDNRPPASRPTSSSYCESAVLDPDGNRVELTV